MEDLFGTDGLRLRVGHLPRAELIDRLRDAGVHLNTHAWTLLDHPVFAQAGKQTIDVAVRTVGGLGLPDGGVLAEVFGAARDQGLLPCPAVTGPYLRLAVPDQDPAPDSVLSQGRAPTGSVTVASVPLSEDDEYPKGFYLRVVDGRSWLRGYRCADQYLWSPEDRLAFCRAE